jgi:hypothetical protein
MIFERKKNNEGKTGMSQNMHSSYQAFAAFSERRHHQQNLVQHTVPYSSARPYRAGRCKSTCMNSMQAGIMPYATFRTVSFQQSSSHSFKNYPKRTFRALVFSKAHSHAKCFSAKWQHDNGGA